MTTGTMTTPEQSLRSTVFGGHPEQRPGKRARNDDSARKRYLGIYLNDHLAGAIGGLALARRASKNNAGTPLGAFLQGFASVLAEDERAVRQTLEATGHRPNVVKIAGGWLSEKMGRLKTNGELLQYSPLSRLIELEELLVGSMGRAQLFRSLAHSFEGHPLASQQRFTMRAERAQQQIEQLKERRLEASERAFGRHGRQHSEGDASAPVAQREPTSSSHPPPLATGVTAAHPSQPTSSMKEVNR